MALGSCLLGSASHLPTSSSVPPPSLLSHAGSFPAHLPKLQICSSLSRWFRAEMRKKPPPSAGSDAPPPPPSSGLSLKCRCLICTLQTGGGHREENPHCQFWPPPTQQGPAGLQTPHRTHSCTNQGLSLPRLYFLFLVSFSPEKKSCFRGGWPEPALEFGSGCSQYPFLAEKGRRGTDLLPAFAGHALCDALLMPLSNPTSFFFFS